MKKPARKMTPMQRAMRDACRTRDLRRLAILYKAGRTVDTLVSGAIFLAVQFSRLGRRKAANGMLRRARLHAADDYRRLLLINVIQEVIRHSEESGWGQE